MTELAANPLDLTRLFHMMSTVAPLSWSVTPRMLGDMVPIEDGPELFQNCLAASLSLPLDDEIQRRPYLEQIESCIALHEPKEWSMRAVICHAALVELEEMAIDGVPEPMSIEETVARLLPIRDQFLAETCIPIGTDERLDGLTERWIWQHFYRQECVPA